MSREKDWACVSKSDSDSHTHIYSRNSHIGLDGSHIGNKPQYIYVLEQNQANGINVHHMIENLRAATKSCTCMCKLYTTVTQLAKMRVKKIRDRWHVAKQSEAERRI